MFLNQTSWLLQFLAKSFKPFKFCCKTKYLTFHYSLWYWGQCHKTLLFWNSCNVHYYTNFITKSVDPFRIYTVTKLIFVFWFWPLILWSTWQILIFNQLFGVIIWCNILQNWPSHSGFIAKWKCDFDFTFKS